MDIHTDHRERERAIYRVTAIGSAANLMLLVFKFVAGILGHSAAMMADAVHSLTDFITDIIVFIFVRISGKPQDTGHDFGHGKYETMATAIVGIILFLTGAGILINGCRDIYEFARGGSLPEPGMIALIAALVSIVVKEILYRVTVAVGRRYDSKVVIANAWHHRSDALSSVATTVGIGGAILLGEKWRVLDPLAAVLVSFLIMKVALDLARPSIDELLEKSLPEETEERIMATVCTRSGVVNPHNLRTRRVGRRNVVDLHVRMDGSKTIAESHEIVSAIEHDLRTFLGKDAIITIHVEPVKERM